MYSMSASIVYSSIVYSSVRVEVCSTSQHETVDVRDRCRDI